MTPRRSVPGKGTLRIHSHGDSEATVNICCPKCASSDGRSVEAIYCECNAPQRRFRRIRAMSRHFAPPEPKHPKFWLSMSIVFAALTGWSTFAASSAATALGACALLSGWMAYEASRYNRADLPRLLDYWHHAFMCSRCGEVYVPG